MSIDIDQVRTENEKTSWFTTDRKNEIRTKSSICLFENSRNNG
jgi:hypothetical protein